MGPADPPARSLMQVDDDAPHITFHQVSGVVTLVAIILLVFFMLVYARMH